jgi:hypothetical protein
MKIKQDTFMTKGIIINFDNLLKGKTIH